MTRLLLLLPLLMVLACGGTTEMEDGAAREPVAPPAGCAEASPTEARLAFPEGEILAMAVADGEIFVGATSLRVNESGALWRVAFDGRPARQLGTAGYIGGPVHVSGGNVVHAEPSDAALNGHLVVTSFDGSRRVVDGPSLILGEFGVADGRAFFFGRRRDGDRRIALWSYDARVDGAQVEHVTDATGGGLFTNGTDVLQAFVDPDPDANPQVVRVRRFDGASRTFSEITSFPVFERGVVGADRNAIYLHDAPTRALIALDLRSGAEIRTLARDIDASGGAHVTDDAIYVYQTSTRHLSRIDTSTGEQAVVARLEESTFIRAFASDACYVYAAVDGFRAIARFPRR